MPGDLTIEQLLHVTAMGAYIAGVLFAAFVFVFKLIEWYIKDEERNENESDS